jgi:hypothetical protein
MVEGVDEVSAKCEPKPFREFPGLRKRQVNIGQPWPEERIPA